MAEDCRADAAGGPAERQFREEAIQGGLGGDKGSGVSGHDRTGRGMAGQARHGRVALKSLDGLAPSSHHIKRPVIGLRDAAPAPLLA